MNETNKKHGIRTIYVFFPTFLVITILYIFIIVSSTFMTNYTKKMRENTEKTSECIDTMTNLLSSANTLSANAISFVYTPIKDSGIINYNPLLNYTNEISLITSRPETIALELKKYDLSANTAILIEGAIECAETLISEQARSLQLISSVSTINIAEKVYVLIPAYTLTANEINMTDEEKLKEALESLMSSLYANYLDQLTENVKKSISYVSEDSIQIQTNLSSKYNFARGFMWTSVLLILAVNIFFFIFLFRHLISRIVGFSNNINNNKRLEQQNRLYEVNVLAIAYDNLLDRHKDYENELKNVAEYDSLTGLPNRYCYNNFVTLPIENDKSSCVFLLDINNLKYVNDNLGHAQGDTLIKNTALAIKECFLIEKKKNCYRIGGDEFVAILDDINKEDIPNIIEKFKLKQKELNISVAIGYAYSDNVKTIGYEKLAMKADKEMYKNKALMYKENGIMKEEK